MFFARFFHRNVVSAAFFLRMYVKKAAKTTFVQKKRVKNVDEIDSRHQCGYGFISLYKYASMQKVGKE
jgi:hypothetical protein